MRRRVKRKSDFGVLVLHWSLTLAVALATATGLRILDPAGRSLGELSQWLLPTNNIWPLHIWAGIALLGFAAAYPVYLLRTGLGGRIALDGARVASLGEGGPAGRGALTVLVYWMLFALLAFEIGTGVALYLGYGGGVVILHRMVTWGLLALVMAHLASHLAFGGSAQLARVFRPAFDAGPAGPARWPHEAEAASRGMRYLAARGGVLLGTAAAALLAVILFIAADDASRDVLAMTRIAKRVAPVAADGLADPIWRRATPIAVHTQQGANFGGSGATVIEIRALRDEDTAYFAFSWDDPTRSLKHMPLVKSADGWHVLRREGDVAAARLPALSVAESADGPRGDGALSEDKLAVMLASGAQGFGPGAFHVGARPLGDKPPPASGRGLHYRTDGRSVEVWLWHATPAPPSGRCEHLHIGPPTRPTADEVLGRAPYKGGIRSDGRRGPMIDNVQTIAAADAEEVTVPLRLPRSLAATGQAMGRIDLHADHGEAEGARWSLTEAESFPYAAALDAGVPVGTLVPGAIATAPTAGTAGDVNCAARWSGGRWTLIVSRRLKAERPDDVALDNGAVLWVAAFDHDPAQHTRHMRPVRLALP